MPCRPNVFARDHRYGVALATVLLRLTCPLSAIAQSSPPPPSSAAPSSSSAPSSPSPDTPAIIEAREHQRRGRGLIAAGNYNGALAEFERVYALLEGHPRRYTALSNIGRCYQGLAQYDRAMEYYQRYLREGGDAAEDRAQVEAAITALDDLLGTLAVTVTVARAEVWSDGRLIGAAPGAIRLPGGRHSVEIRAPGFSPSRREIEIAAHQRLELRFALEPLGRRLSPRWFWMGLAATGLSAVGGAAFGVAAVAARRDVDARLASPELSIRFTVSDEDTARIQAFARDADIFFAVTGALAVGTVVTLFLTDFHSTTEPSRPRAMWMVAPLATAGAIGAQFGGVL
jgi:hypothetical protein